MILPAALTRKDPVVPVYESKENAYLEEEVDVDADDNETDKSSENENKLEEVGESKAFEMDEIDIRLQVINDLLRDEIVEMEIDQLILHHLLLLRMDKVTEESCISSRLLNTIDQNSSWNWDFLDDILVLPSEVDVKFEEELKGETIRHDGVYEDFDHSSEFVEETIQINDPGIVGTSNEDIVFVKVDLDEETNTRHFKLSKKALTRKRSRVVSTVKDLRDSAEKTFVYHDDNDSKKVLPKPKSRRSSTGNSSHSKGLPHPLSRKNTPRR